MCISIAGCSNGDSSSETPSSGDSSSQPEKKPVVETMGDLDISDYIIKTDVDENFLLEFEGEDGTLSGSAAVYKQKFLGEYSGEGFVGSLIDDQSAVEFTAEIPGDGSFDIIMMAAGDIDGETGSILVDGNITSNFTVASSKEFTEAVAEKVSLTKGTHKISIMKNTTNIYIDTVKIKAAEPVDLSIFDVSNQLSNPNANDTTKRLYNFLTDIYGKYILSGNYADENTGGGIQSREFKEIHKMCDDYPAIMGLDLINLSPGAVSHGAGSNVILNAMEWNQKGGIVTLCWHWYAPEKYLEANGEPWWRGFYKEATSFDLGAAMNGTDKEGYDLIVRDIDAIAEALKELQSYDIPILWRPLHEAAGDPKWNNAWFWWGASGKDAYVELWKLMYDRLTNYHGLNNLIWVWNAQNVSWYPGDEYVDIIGYDIYAEEHNSSSQKETFDYIRGATSTKKIIALTENGVIPDPDACMSEGARWSWFATWVGEFTLKDAQISDQYTTLEMWNKVYSHDRVLTLSELPDWRSYPLDTEAFLNSQGK